MIRRIVLLAALLPLAGCGAAALPWVVATGGILTGVAAVTKADVDLFQVYIDWRTGSPPPRKAKVGSDALPTPAVTH